MIDDRGHVDDLLEAGTVATFSANSSNSAEILP